MKSWTELVREVREAVPGQESRPFLRCTEGCLRGSDYGVAFEGTPVFFGWSGCPVHGIEAQKAEIRVLVGKGPL